MGSHHSDEPMGPFQRKAFEELRAATEKGRSETMRKLLDTTGFIGATGDFPKGRLNKSDEGGIQFAVGSDGDKVILDFGKPVHWIGMDAEQAADLASYLMKQAREVARRQGKTVTLDLSI